MISSFSKNLPVTRVHFFFLLGVILAVLTRVSLFSHVSPDVTGFVLPWFKYLNGKSFSLAFGTYFSAYNPPYLYFLWLSTLLKLDPLFSIKLLALSFEFLCALSGALVVRAFGFDALASFIVLLFSPTLIINGSMWGQADAVYTAFTVFAVLYVIKNRPLPSFVCWGLSFAVKAQALFVLPAYFILWVINQIDARTVAKGLFLSVGVFLLTLLPAFLAGQSLNELFGTYPRQFNIYGSLNMSAPNLWQWFRNEGFPIFRPAGLCFTAGIVIIWALFSVNRSYHDRPKTILIAFTLSSLLIPFFAPKMHDRYFFIADVLTVILALVIRQTWWIALCVNFCSLFAYMDWIWGTRPFSWTLIPFVNLAALIGLAHQWQQCQRPATNPELCNDAKD